MYEFDDAAKRGVPDQREPERDLFEPPAGDWQREQDLVVCAGGRREERIECAVGAIYLSVDSWATHAAALSDDTDGFGAGECLECAGFTGVPRQFARGESIDWRHGNRAAKNGALSSPDASPLLNV